MDSEIERVKLGNNRLTVIVTRSAVPYSSVDKQEVYNGTKRSVISREPKVPIANIPLSFNNDLYSDI